MTFTKRWSIRFSFLMIVSFVGACGSDMTSATTGGGGAGGSEGVSEPKLAAACDDMNPCPSTLTCELGIGCTIDPCPTPGVGAAHGCPANGFCYMFDGMTAGYCARICVTDADCTAVNPGLSCLERTATEGYMLKICVPPGG